MDEQSRIQENKGTLKSFLEMFENYSKEIFGKRRRKRLDELRIQLQSQEPQVTNLIVEIIGADRVIGLGRTGSLGMRDLLPSALMGGNNELSFNFYDYKAPVLSILNRALGHINSGLYPPKETKPVLVIKDNELRSRCSDLLKAPGAYDRVIREATTVLEDRIRNKCPHPILARLIPNAADQTGENLVNKLLSPSNPVLVFSSEQRIRSAFQKIMLGVFAHLRNPYHHRIDPNTEWSWAWSTVGLIDRLLADIESCTVVQ